MSSRVEQELQPEATIIKLTVAFILHFICNSKNHGEFTNVTCSAKIDLLKI